MQEKAGDRAVGGAAEPILQHASAHTSFTVLLIGIAALAQPSLSGRITL